MRIAIAAMLVGLAAAGTAVPQLVSNPVPKGMISPSWPVAKGMAQGLKLIDPEK